MYQKGDKNHKTWRSSSSYWFRTRTSELETEWLNHIHRIDLKTRSQNPAAVTCSLLGIFLFVCLYRASPWTPCFAAYSKTKPLSFTSFCTYKVCGLFIITITHCSSLISLWYYLIRAFLNLIKIHNRFLKYYYNKSLLKSTLFLSFSRESFLFIRL